MARNTNLRSRRSAAQLDALAGVRREIRSQDSSEHRKYLKDFSQAYRSYESVLDNDQLAAEIQKADILLIGDYHALPASQRYAAALMEQRAQPGDRPIVLGVETIFSRDQHIVDEWWRHEADENELRHRLRFDIDWGYEWSPFYELLLSAREHGEGVYGLDCMPRENLRRIGARDRHAAVKMSEIRQQHPNAVIAVLFGESHLAPGHLPRAVRVALPNDHVTTVLQNIDPLYWRAAGEENDCVEAVKISEEVFCVFTSTPLEKYENYRLHLSRWGRDGNDPDMAPTFYNLVESLMRFLDIDGYSSHNGTQPKFLVDLLPEIDSGACEDRLIKLLERWGVTSHEAILQQLESRGCVYIPELNTFHAREFQMAYAAEDAARFLHHACRGLPVRRRLKKTRSGDVFFEKVIEHALGYLGSRILYPARPAVSGQRLPSSPDENPAAGAELLGFMLGNSLYDKYVQGRVTRLAIRRLFMTKLNEPGAARTLYEELSNKLRSGKQDHAGA
ncbi:MAG TPA: ChaN family lipoprotein [Terriglobales bacterium]|jgi:hypothetical protein